MTAIQKYRTAAGLTQEALAEILGVTQSAVAMWEGGDRKPNIFILKRIAVALKCTTDDLLEPIEPAKE